MASDAIEVFWSGADESLQRIFSAHESYMESALGTTVLPEALRGGHHALLLRDDAELSTGAKVALTLCRPGLGLDSAVAKAGGMGGLEVYLASLEIRGLRETLAANGGKLRVHLNVRYPLPATTLSATRCLPPSTWNLQPPRRSSRLLVSAAWASTRLICLLLQCAAQMGCSPLPTAQTPDERLCALRFCPPAAAQGAPVVAEAGVHFWLSACEMHKALRAPSSS